MIPPLDEIKFLAVGFTRPVFSLFLIYILYLLCGSLCFVVLESEGELEARNRTIKAIRKTQVMVNKLLAANYSQEDINGAVQMQKYKALAASMDVAWYQTYGEKVFFAFILISTIGYGNVAPKSHLGMIVCIIYTMIGLPLHVIMMRLLSVKYRDVLRRTFKLSLKFFPGSRIMVVTVGILFFLFWIGLYLIIPPIFIMAEEKWEYYQAFYFSFVSLTTIGLGDYVAGVPEGYEEGPIYALKVIATIIWFFLGIGFVFMAVNMMSYIMALYSLDKLDCKCRERTVAMKKLSDLLELIKELNWQLTKGKPDDFDKWDEIESFKNLLAKNPQDITPTMLQNMFDIILDLKEKAYEQVFRMQLVSIPTSPLLRRAKDTIPDILSTDSVKVYTVKDSRRKKLGRTKSESLDDMPEIIRDKQNMEASSQLSFAHTGQFQIRSPERSPEKVADVDLTNIIEDRRHFDERVEEDDSVEEDLKNPEKGPTNENKN